MKNDIQKLGVGGCWPGYYRIFSRAKYALTNPGLFLQRPEGLQTFGAFALFAPN
jgi:hypothetical protein